MSKIPYDPQGAGGLRRLPFLPNGGRRAARGSTFLVNAEDAMPENKRGGFHELEERIHQLHGSEPSETKKRSAGEQKEEEERSEEGEQEPERK